MKLPKWDPQLIWCYRYGLCSELTKELSGICSDVVSVSIIYVCMHTRVCMSVGLCSAS